MIVERYRTRPVHVNAVRWDGTREAAVEIAQWVNVQDTAGHRLSLVSANGDLYVNGWRVRPGWYVYLGPEGLSLADAKRFTKEYEPVRPEVTDRA